MPGSAGELAQQEDLGSEPPTRHRECDYGEVFGWQLQDGATPNASHTLPSVLQTFYTHLFRWQFTEQPLAPHPLYVMWKRGEKAVGGLLPIGEDWNISPRWQVLFQVDDLEASVARVVAAGGTAEFGPLDVPRAGLLTSVRDPRGGLHVLVQPHLSYPPR